MDNKAEKHFYESPYVYVSNNPLVFFDPDGEEKIIALNPEKDKNIISAAQKYKDDNAIHIFSHGWSGGISVTVNGEKYSITGAKGLEQFLSKTSETWQNKEEGGRITIVLHSCNTAKDGKAGKDSFAQKVSKSETFNDATIVAPDERVFFSEEGEIGAYESKTTKEGEIERNEKGVALKSDKTGSWRVFQGGKQTGQYSGDWKPKEQPTILDNLNKKEEVK